MTASTPSVSTSCSGAPSGRDDVEVDVLIVGAGPAGLFAAYCAGFRGMSVALIPEPGGQVAALYPEKLIHDVAGLPAVRGRDLVDSPLRRRRHSHHLDRPLALASGHSTDAAVRVVVPAI